MCGIAGLVGNADQNSIACVEKMLRAMVHRGPDQEGLWCTPSGEAVFGHRRLSIIDLSEAGRQPMVHQATGVCLVYNGECYNYKEISEELKRYGHQFNSSSDTEVVLNAYVEWGIEFVSRLRGMFTIAIWDPRCGETLLLRDRLGIKPLYYTTDGGSLLFASELRALLATGKVKRTLNSGAVASYLWQGFVPGPETIVAEVLRLDPATLMRVSSAGKILEKRKYWKPAPTTIQGDPAASLQASHEHLVRAINEHLVSDVPLGVFLSGGVDSSVVAALAQRNSMQSVTTYNISFEEAGFDESIYAREVAERLNTNHHQLTLTESIFEDQLEDAIGCLDQPTFDAINTYFVSRAVREAGLTVALAGTGGDELFGGYSSFRDLPRTSSILRPLAALPHSLQDFTGGVAQWLMSRGSGEIRPQVRWGKVADMIATRGELIGLYQVSYALFTRDFQNSIGHIDVPETQHWGMTASKVKSLQADLDSQNSMLAKISQLELANFLGERLLPDTDAASMASSLEVRVPLLDHAFVESLSQLPDELRYSPIGRKQFLLSAVSEELDASLFDRPKAGFELPLEKWCKNKLAPQLDSTFRDINLAHSVGLDAEGVSRLWRSFQNGAPGLYWSRVWSIYVLMNWCKRHGLTIA